jgi:hypothetical protein
MTITFRPLGKVRDIFQATGLDINYAYDDLVFSENSVFIIRFDIVKSEGLHLYFNVDCDEGESKRIKKCICDACKTSEFEILGFGQFTVKQIDGKEELELKFLYDHNSSQT